MEKCILVLFENPTTFYGWTFNINTHKSFNFAFYNSTSYIDFPFIYSEYLIIDVKQFTEDSKIVIAIAFPITSTGKFWVLRPANIWVNWN